MDFEAQWRQILADKEQTLAPARIPLDMRGAITEAPLEPGRPQGGRFEHLSVGVDNSHHRHRAVRAQASSSSTRLSRRAKSNTSTYGRIDGIRSIRISASISLVPSPGSLRVTLMRSHSAPSATAKCQVPLSISAA